MHAFDGKNLEDKRLWHSYVRLAREHAKCIGGVPRSTKPAIVDDPHHVLNEQLREVLQTVVFSAFVLEYRLKRVLDEMGCDRREKETLGKLFGRFWQSLSTVERIDRRGHCAPPSGWAPVEKRLKKLIELRKAMAHANFKSTLTFLGAGIQPQALETFITPLSRRLF